MDNFQFTKGYIEELAKRRGDLSKGSYGNCHAKGLYSIILQENPIVRLFVATRNHELHSTIGPYSIPSSIAFHPHHCDLKFDVICGELINFLFLPECVASFIHTGYKKYSFDSKINGGRGKFSRSDDLEYSKSLVYNTLNAGDVEIMKASDIHTVYVPLGRVTSWLVTEGKEDPSFEPVAYSIDQDLETLNMDELYKPITHTVAETVLKIALTSL